MALTSTPIAYTAGLPVSPVYTSSGSNAITSMIICNLYEFNPANPTANTANLSLYAVPSGVTLTANHLIVNAVPITAGETLSLDQEKLVLANGDMLYAKSSVASTLVMAISTLTV
jgi:hypothetical protein